MSKWEIFGRSIIVATALSFLAKVIEVIETNPNSLTIGSLLWGATSMGMLVMAVILAAVFVTK